MTNNQAVALRTLELLRKNKNDGISIGKQGAYSTLNIIKYSKRQAQRCAVGSHLQTGFWV